MLMDNNTDFQGNKLKRTAQLQVYWKEHMFFDGRRAEFTGDIQACQEESRLACQSLQVSLDRRVSLKEGDKGADPAKVKDVLCDKSVRAEEEIKAPDGKLIRKQRIETPTSLHLDNENQE